MADLDTLRIRGIPFRALVDGEGVAVAGTDTIKDLADEGMAPICQVDGTGTGVVGSQTPTTLLSRGIPVFCEVDQTGTDPLNSLTLSQLRNRGIPGCCIVGLDGIAQGGSLTIAQLRERGIGAFCPVDENGTATTLSAARITLTGQIVAENTANGTTVGTLATVNTTGTAAFTLADTAGGRFSLTGNLLKVANSTLLDYEVDQFHTITVSVTGVTPAIANRTFLILVTNVDDTAPVITSSSSVSNVENTVLSHTLTADETVTWAKTGGVDTAQFTLTGSVLSWATTTTRDYETPLDSDANNTYVVQVTATDAASNATNQTITVTVTDVLGTAPDAPVLALTSGTTDNTPDFTLTGDLAELDTVRFQYSTSAVFSGASEITNTIDSAEDAANSLSFSTGSLANNTWYFRARIERPGVPEPGVSAWSNTETIAISVVSAAATTWNPSDKSAGITLSNSDRTVTHPSGGNTVEGIRSVAAAASNQLVYIEHLVTTITSAWFFGFSQSGGTLAGFPNTNTPSIGFLINTANGSLTCVDSAEGGNQLLGGGEAITPGDRMCMAFNTATGKVWVRKNSGSWNPANFSGDPAAGTGGATIPFSGPYYVWGLMDANNGDVFTTAFASADWAYAAPSGFTQLAA